MRLRVREDDRDHILALSIEDEIRLSSLLIWLWNRKTIYRYFDGWAEDISNIRNFDELLENCQKYVKFIEEYTGTSVSLVSVSPKRSGKIIRKELL